MTPDYRKYLSTIKNQEFKELLHYIDDRLETMSDFDPEFHPSEPKDTMKIFCKSEKLKLKFGFRDQPFSFIINKNDILFYIREESNSLRKLSLFRQFKGAKKPNHEQITIPLGSVEEIDIFFKYLFSEKLGIRRLTPVKK